MTYDSPIEGDKAIPGNGYVPPFSIERATELGVDAETGEPEGNVNPDSHTRAELDEMAVAAGLDVTGLATKAEVAAAINEARGG
jgi:hypothetical protein